MLEGIKSLLSSHSPLNSFAPIKSFHRIIISYANVDAAIQMRQHIDGASTEVFYPQDRITSNRIETDSNGTSTSTPRNFDRIRCYFGQPTPVSGEDIPDQYLKAPDPGKLFFISPPPSPPCGWESREEEPPNKATHADDLERALAGLGQTADLSMNDAPEDSPMEDVHFDRNGNLEERIDAENEGIEGRQLKNRSRTKSMTVYHPKDHGSKEDLPAVVVSDMEADEEEEDSAPAAGGRKPITHTTRPPVELME